MKGYPIEGVPKEIMREPVPASKKKGFVPVKPRSKCPVAGFRDRIAALPKLAWKPHGKVVAMLPVAFSARRNNFKQIAFMRGLQAARHDLCGVCGEKLDQLRVFLASATYYQKPQKFSEIESMWVDDPPMHPPCAELVLKICPHYADKELPGLWIECTSSAIRIRPAWNSKYLNRASFAPRGVISQHLLPW